MNDLLEKKAKIEFEITLAETNESKYDIIADRMIEKIEPPPPPPRNYKDISIKQLIKNSEIEMKKNDSILKKNEIVMESVKYKSFKDSALIYTNLKSKYISMLKNIIYSIDSLTKLK
jgi:hypothetical protein